MTLKLTSPLGLIFIGQVQNHLGENGATNVGMNGIGFSSVFQRRGWLLLNLNDQAFMKSS